MSTCENCDRLNKGLDELKEFFERCGGRFPEVVRCKKCGTTFKKTYIDCGGFGYWQWYQLGPTEKLTEEPTLF